LKYLVSLNNAFLKLKYLILDSVIFNINIILKIGRYSNQFMIRVFFLKRKSLILFQSFKIMLKKKIIDFMNEKDKRRKQKRFLIFINFMRKNKLKKFFD
jgi:hypothetical protein